MGDAFRHTGNVLHALHSLRGYRKSQLSRMTSNVFHLRRRRESNPRPLRKFLAFWVVSTDALDRAATAPLAHFKIIRKTYRDQLQVVMVGF